MSAGRALCETLWKHLGMIAFCRLLIAIAALWLSTSEPGLAAPRDLRVISFNIKFVGNSPQKRNDDLAEMLAAYDLVFVQELVAPPYPGTFPDGTPFVPDAEAAAFFAAMKAKRFEYVLSEEDTGTRPRNHLNSSATEWFVAFYKPGRVTPVSDLPHGFLADDRTDHPDFERVPYVYSLRGGKPARSP